MNQPGACEQVTAYWQVGAKLLMCTGACIKMLGVTIRYKKTFPFLPLGTKPLDHPIVQNTNLFWHKWKKIKNKNGFQNCYGITSVFFKKQMKLAREKGIPTTYYWTLEDRTVWKKACEIGIFILEITVTSKENCTVSSFFSFWGQSH